MNIHRRGCEGLPPSWQPKGADWLWVNSLPHRSSHFHYTLETLSFALLNIVLASTAHTHHTSILHNYLYVHRNGFHRTHIILHFIALPLDNELPFAITFLTTLLFHYISHYTPHFHSSLHSTPQLSVIHLILSCIRYCARFYITPSTPLCYTNTFHVSILHSQQVQS